MAGGASIARANSDNAATAITNAQQLYQGLRVQAVAAGCPDTALPTSFTIDYYDETVNAAASLDDANRPTLVVNRGLIDFDGLDAYYSQARDESQRTRAFRVMLNKVRNPAGTLRITQEWSDWSAVGELPWSWAGSFRSRLAFALAHEIGHHCKGHTGLVHDSEASFLVYRADHTVEARMHAAVRYPQHPNDTDAARMRTMEREADGFAVELLEASHEALNLDFDSLFSAPAELAILDAAAGRCAPGTDANQWTHPVGPDRFEDIVTRLGRSHLLAQIANIAFLERIDHMILCLARDRHPLDLFQTMVDTGSPVCLAAPDLPTLTSLMQLGAGSTAVARLTVEVHGSSARPVVASGQLASLDFGGSAFLKGLKPLGIDNAFSRPIRPRTQYRITFTSADAASSFRVLLDDHEVATGRIDSAGHVVRLSQKGNLASRIRDQSLLLSVPGQGKPASARPEP